MDLFDAIARRHCYRGAYLPQPVSREDLRKIVQAGLDAPSGKNGQTTTFVVVDDEAILSKIRPLHDSNKAMQQARAYIACVIDREPEAVFEGYSFQVEDCAAAVENMLLAVTALGYASVWIDGWLRLNHNAETVGRLLGVPAGKVVRILLPIGVPQRTEWPTPPKKTFSERAWFNCYEGAE